VTATGDLRHRLVIEAGQRSDDGGGGALVNWVTVATVWGAVIPLAGREAVSAERLAGQVSHRIVVRYRDDVTPSMRIRQGARSFRIMVTLDPDQRRHWLHCLCEEEVAG